MVPEWYYAENGQQRGPVTFDIIQALAISGKLRPTDLVWKVGMPQWVPANTQSGLFAPMPVPRPVEPRESYRDDDWEPRSPIKKSGGGVGWIVGSIVGVLLLLGCCGVGGVVIAVIANSKPSNVRTWSLASGKEEHWAIPFNQGDNVAITVTSDYDSDVDLFVFADKAKMDATLKAPDVDKAAAFNCVKFDNGLSKDCYVSFTAPHTGTYYVVVANRRSAIQPTRNRHNSGKMEFSPLR
jgi:hypothetical protein